MLFGSVSQSRYGALSNRRAVCIEIEPACRLVEWERNCLSFLSLHRHCPKSWIFCWNWSQTQTIRLGVAARRVVQLAALPSAEYPMDSGPGWRMDSCRDWHLDRCRKYWLGWKAIPQLVAVVRVRLPLLLVAEPAQSHCRHIHCRLHK